jgi:hypothetical protein
MSSRRLQAGRAREQERHAPVGNHVPARFWRGGMQKGVLTRTRRCWPLPQGRPALPASPTWHMTQPLPDLTVCMVQEAAVHGQKRLCCRGAHLPWMSSVSRKRCRPNTSL